MAIFCSFCGKANDAVRLLVAGPNVQICDECVVLAAEIVGCDTPDVAGKIAPSIETVEQKTDAGWSVWSVNKSKDDQEKTLGTLRRCNPQKSYRAARYLRISVGSESSVEVVETFPPRTT